MTKSISNIFFAVVSFSLLFLISVTPVLAQDLPTTIDTTVKNIFGSSNRTQSGTAPGTGPSSQICELISWTSTCHKNSNKPFQLTKICCTFEHPDGTLEVSCENTGITCVRVEHPETGELIDLDDLCYEYLSERPFEDYMNLPAYIRNYCETAGSYED